MFPINHPDDSVGPENLDSNVPEHQDASESHTPTDKPSSDSCSTKQYVRVISKQPLKTMKETLSRDSTSATEQQASSKHRFTGRNYSSFSSEKRRDRQHDEHYRHKADNRHQKMPSDTNVKEPTPILAMSFMSNEVVNGETAVSESPMETANQCSSGDQDAKPAMPSGRKQNSNANRSSNYYTHSRNRFYSSYSKHSDAYWYDDYDDYVLHPRHNRDHKRNRQPKSVKTTTEAVSNDAGNDFDEDSNDYQREHAAGSSAVSIESNTAVVSGYKQNKPQFRDVPHQRRNNGHRSYRNTRIHQTSTLDDNSTLPTRFSNPEQCQSDFVDSRNNTEMKSRTQNYRPRKYWNRKTPDEASRLSMDKDEELQKTTDVLSHLSVKMSKGNDVQREQGAVEVTKDDCFASAEQQCVKQADVSQTSGDRSSQGARSNRRRNHTRRGDTHFNKEPAPCDDHQCGQDRADGSSFCVEKEPYPKNRGSRRGTRRNFHRESQPSNDQHSYDNQTVCVDRQTE